MQLSFQFDEFKRTLFLDNFLLIPSQRHPDGIYLLITFWQPHRHRTVSRIRHRLVLEFLPPKNRINGFFFIKVTLISMSLIKLLSLSWVSFLLLYQRWQQKIATYWKAEHSPTTRTRNIRKPPQPASTLVSFESVQESTSIGKRNDALLCYSHKHLQHPLMKRGFKVIRWHLVVLCVRSAGWLQPQMFEDIIPVCGLY